MQNLGKLARLLAVPVVFHLLACLTAFAGVPGASGPPRPAHFAADSAAMASRVADAELSPLTRFTVLDSCVQAIIARAPGDTLARAMALRVEAGLLPPSWSAVARARTAVALESRCLAEDHPETILGLVQLADALSRLGHTTAAEEVADDAIRRVDRSRAQDPVSVASVWLAKGRVLRHGADDLEASVAECARKALEIARAMSVPDTMLLASCHSMLGTALAAQGRHALARVSLERALELREAVVGRRSPLLVTILEALRDTYGELHDQARSQAMYDWLDEIPVVRVSDTEDDDPIQGAQFLAIMEALGQVDRTEKVVPARAFEAALDSVAARGRSVSWYFLKSMLVASLAKHGQLRDALACSALPDSVVPTGSHESIGLILLAWTRADVLHRMGRHDQEERELHPYLDERRGASSIIETYRRAWRAYRELLHGRAAAALDIALVTHREAQANAVEAITQLSEREALNALPNPLRSLSLGMEAAEQGLPPARMFDLMDQVAGSRGIVLDIVSARRRLEHRRGRIEDQRRVATAGLDRARIANLQRSGAPDDRDSASFWRTRLERAQREEALALSENPAARPDPSGLSRQLVDALPDGGVLVSFVTFSKQESLGVSGSFPDDEGEGHLAALVLERGPAPPRFVEFGRAAAVESLVVHWRFALESSRSAAKDGPEFAALDSLGQRLTATLWEPLKVDEKRARFVFVVPDGPIHDLDFTVLPSVSGHPLVERGFALHRLMSEQDLLPGERLSSPAAGVLALGQIDYSGSQSPTPSSELHDDAMRAANAPRRRVRSAFDDIDAGRMTDPFEPLPSTGRELDSLSALMANSRVSREGHSDLRVLRGSEATEAAFKSLAPGSRWIHVATHGFCVRVPKRAWVEATATRAGMWRQTDDELMSGLVLAGANIRASGPSENGFLTAEEIEDLDLTHTDLVVLSACDTGAGESLPGEGQLGLQRSFSLAGARSMVTSLWKVDDALAAEWMAIFYRTRLADGASLPESARAASLECLRRLRARGVPAHPARWAGFVTSGDWR